MKSKQKRRSGNPWQGVKEREQLLLTQITDLQRTLTDREKRIEQLSDAITAETIATANNNDFLNRENRERTLQQEIDYLRATIARISHGGYHIERQTRV
jgi:hypothetical protein